MNAPRAIALCQCFNGALEFQAGHWDSAKAALEESISLYGQIGAASGEALAWQRLGVLQTARGQLEEAMRSFNEGVVVAERATMRAHCLTRLYASITRNRLLAGDLDAAGQYLALGLAMGERHGNCSTCDALLLPVAVSVAVAREKFDEAEAFCWRLDKAASEYGSRTWVAMARQARGELAAAQGDLESALGYYSEALEGFRDAGYDYEAARTLEAAAEVRRLRGSPVDLETALQAGREAEQIFERLASG
jgi:tetratricopeptide (TPR) repeat protein